MPAAAKDTDRLATDATAPAAKGPVNWPICLNSSMNPTSSLSTSSGALISSIVWIGGLMPFVSAAARKKSAPSTITLCEKYIATSMGVRIAEKIISDLCRPT